MIEAREKVWVGARRRAGLEIPLRGLPRRRGSPSALASCFADRWHGAGGLGRFDERSDGRVATGRARPGLGGAGIYRAAAGAGAGAMQGTGEATLSKQLGAILESSRDYRPDRGARPTDRGTGALRRWTVGRGLPAARTDGGSDDLRWLCYSCVTWRRSRSWVMPSRRPIRRC